MCGPQAVQGAAEQNPPAGQIQPAPPQLQPQQHQQLSRSKTDCTGKRETKRDKTKVYTTKNSSVPNEVVCKGRRYDTRGDPSTAKWSSAAPGHERFVGYLHLAEGGREIFKDLLYSQSGHPRARRLPSPPELLLGSLCGGGPAAEPPGRDREEGTTIAADPDPEERRTGSGDDDALAPAAPHPRPDRTTRDYPAAAMEAGENGDDSSPPSISSPPSLLSASPSSSFEALPTKLKSQEEEDENDENGGENRDEELDQKEAAQIKRDAVANNYNRRENVQNDANGGDSSPAATNGVEEHGNVSDVADIYKDPDQKMRHEGCDDGNLKALLEDGVAAIKDSDYERAIISLRKICHVSRTHPRVSLSA